MVDLIKIHQGGFLASMGALSKPGEYVHVGQPLYPHNIRCDTYGFHPATFCGIFDGIRDQAVFVSPVKNTEVVFSLYSPHNVIVENIYFTLDGTRQNTVSAPPLNTHLSKITLVLERSDNVKYKYLIVMKDISILKFSISIGDYIKIGELLTECIYIDDLENDDANRKIFDDANREICSLKEEITLLKIEKESLRNYIEEKKQAAISSSKNEAQVKANEIISQAELRGSQIIFQQSEIADDLVSNSKAKAKKILKKAKKEAEGIITDADRVKLEHERELSYIELRKREVELETARLNSQSSETLSDGIDAMINEAKGSTNNG